VKILFLCPACERLTVFSEFRIEGDALVLRCVRCRVESRSQAVEAAPSVATIAAAASSSATAPLRQAALALLPTQTERAAGEEILSVPEGHCPKCVAVRPPEASSCAHCGLVFSNYKPEELEPSSALAEHFHRLLSNWDDVEEHDRVIQAAVKQGELAVLGRLYRIRLARSADDAFAARGRDEVLRLATAGTAGLARGESEAISRYRSTGLIAALFAMVLFLVIALYATFRRYSGS
jgi:hypothetical protein